MNRFYQITNPEAVVSNIHFVIDNIPCVESEWRRRGVLFYDNVVGMKIGESESDGKKLFFLRCGPELFIPVVDSGLKEISYSQFSRLYHKNISGTQERKNDTPTFSASVRVPIVLNNGQDV